MNPYSPGCPHIDWHQGDQYSTFIAEDETQRAEQATAKQADAAKQGMTFDGEPHLCPEVGTNLYLVALKAS